jgi:hypothetical protein
MPVGSRWRGRSEFGSNNRQQLVILRRVLCAEGSVQLDVRDPAVDGLAKLHRSLRLRAVDNPHFSRKERARNGAPGNCIGPSARKGRGPQDDSGFRVVRPHPGLPHPFLGLPRLALWAAFFRRVSGCFPRLLNFVHAEGRRFCDVGGFARPLSAMPRGENLSQISVAVSGNA